MNMKIVAALVGACLCVLVVRPAYAADPPGPINPTTPMCLNVAGTTYVPCSSASAAGSPIISVPASGTGSFQPPVTVTNASTQVLAAGVAKTILDIKNESMTASIACAFGATAALNTAGSYTLPPGWHRAWEGSFVPSDAVNCISSVASSPATIEAK